MSIWVSCLNPQGRQDCRGKPAGDGEETRGRPWCYWFRSVDLDRQEKLCQPQLSGFHHKTGSVWIYPFWKVWAEKCGLSTWSSTISSNVNSILTELFMIGIWPDRRRLVRNRTRTFTLMRSWRKFSSSSWKIPKDPIKCLWLSKYASHQSESIFFQSGLAYLKVECEEKIQGLAVHASQPNSTNPELQFWAA